jgi:hypothetical protein
MHIHPISIQVPSVTSVATGCIFLTALNILGMLGLVGGYPADNRKELKGQKRRQRGQETDRQSGVAGGCGNIWVVTSARNTTPLETG